jgi:hypothetical protein
LQNLRPKLQAKLDSEHLFLLLTVIVVSRKIGLCFLALVLVSLLFSGCALPPGSVPYDRVDFFNNVQGTYVVLSDQGGTMPRKIGFGEVGWIPYNTYFQSGNGGMTASVHVTARFYEVGTDRYLGDHEYRSDKYGPGPFYESVTLDSFNRASKP